MAQFWSQGIMTITSPLPGGTPGSVLFVGAGSTISQDNANFFWDATNHRLGIGMNAPTELLMISAAAGTTARLAVLSGTHRIDLKINSTSNKGWVGTTGAADDMVIRRADTDFLIIIADGSVVCLTTTGAFRPPVLTTVQKNAIAAPVAGDTVYDSTLNKLSVYTGAAWETVTSV